MADKALENLSVCQNNNFWIAYDSLEAKNAQTILYKGIQLAKDLQQAIVRMGQSLIDRREVKVSHHFRYVIIENDFLKDTTIFQFPLALQKLGLFILELYQSEKKNAKNKPLVISVKNGHTGMTLVIAVTGYNQQETAINDFSVRFKLAAQQVGASAKHDGFDSGMTEVPNKDWQKFIQNLAQLN